MDNLTYLRTSINIYTKEVSVRLTLAYKSLKHERSRVRRHAEGFSAITFGKLITKFLIIIFFVCMHLTFACNTECTFLTELCYL